MNEPSFKVSRPLSAAIALVLSAAASGAELEYGALVGGSYSDNVERVPTNEQSSGAAVVGVDLRGSRTAGRLLYDVFADLQYHDYFDSDIENQEFGRVIAQGSYAFVPETFSWSASGSFDQIREDLLRPVAPDNLENVFVLSTGPQLTVRFGDSFRADAQAQYTTANYSELTFDNDTASAELTFGRALSERSYIGLGGSYADVSYDVSDNVIRPDYERREYFIRFNTEGARTTVNADAGYSEVSGDGIDADGPMARVRLTRRLTPFVSGFVSYTHEFSTSADAAYTPAPSEGGIIADSSILTPGPREVRLTDVGLTMSRPRLEASLVYSMRDEASSGPLGFDRDYSQLFASIDRPITTRSSVGLFGSYTSEEIEAGETVESNESSIGARAELAFGRALSVEIQIQRRKRDSDVGIGEYEEMSGGIFVRYGSARRQAAALASLP